MPDFAEFYRGAHPGLVAELYAYTGNLAEAQEIAQEAFVRAWLHWRKVRSYDQPRAWVARVAYRLATGTELNTVRGAGEGVHPLEMVGKELRTHQLDPASVGPADVCNAVAW